MDIKKNKVVRTLIAGSILLFPILVMALPTVDDDQIELSKNCNTSDCFSDVATMLDWIWDTRNPTAASPIIVNVGPGTFEIPDRRFCDNAGHITVRGSGQDNTVLTGGLQSTGHAAVVSIFRCVNFSMESLSIITGSRGGIGATVNGIVWVDGGNSTWTNMTVKASQYAWVDYDLGATSCDGIHYWFASKVETRGGAYQNTYRTQCGENWFYGGEIAAFNEGGNAGTAALIPVAAFDGGNMHIFGSAVRSISTTTATAASLYSYLGQTGLRAAGGKIHMHGGIVNVSSFNDSLNQNVTGASADSSISLIHVLDTSFNIRPSGTGIATRISDDPNGTGINTGNIKSSFHWQASEEPPAILSLTGNDMYVETDCSASGCQVPGDQPHLLIYSESCGSNGFDSWLDTTTSLCRGEVPPPPPPPPAPEYLIDRIGEYPVFYLSDEKCVDTGGAWRDTNGACRVLN